MSEILWKSLDRYVHRKGTFQDNSLLPLLFVTTLIPFSANPGEAVQGHKFQQGMKVNILVYIDNLNLWGKGLDDLERLMNTARIPIDDILIRFEITEPTLAMN